MRTIWIATLALALALVGCGGGGGGNGSGNLNVFLTDSPSTYTQVWSEIHKIELLDADGAATTVFDDSTGRVVNLAALKDNTGSRYLFLNNATGSSKQFVSARVTAHDRVRLVQSNGTVDDRALRGTAAGAGMVQIVFPLDAPRTGTGNLVVDFNLASLTLGSDDVEIPLQEKTGAQVDSDLHDQSRQEKEDYKGTVSALTGTVPDQTFTLTMGSSTITVLANSSTVIYRADGAPITADNGLANGVHIKARGTFDPTTNQLVAASIRIGTNNVNDDLPHVVGVPSNVSEGARSFVITISEADGVALDTLGATITVQTDDTTTFVTHSGLVLTQTEFFTALATATKVEVEGTVTNGVLTAKKARIEDGSGDHENEIEAKGSFQNLDATAGTFQLTGLMDWEGFRPTQGLVLDITTNGNTVYKDGNGQVTTKDAFFAALVGTVKVEVRGVMTGNAVVASRLQLDN